MYRTEQGATPNVNPVASALEQVGTPIARGVGYALVGPAVAGALSSPDIKAAAWSLALPVGAAIVGGVALGVIVGLWLGRGR